MTTITIVYLILSIIIAGGLSYYQYFFKNRLPNKTHKFLSIIRFLTIFGILLLIINPKITKHTFQIEKPFLPVFVDNSASVDHLKSTETTNEIFKTISENKKLSEKYTIQNYAFDTEVTLSEEFNFKGKQTNIDKIAKNLKSVYKNKQYPTIIISDGNQTIGADYVYSFQSQNKIFPVIIGDTTQYIDLKINQLNVNKYAYLKNKFPVEVFLQYNGTKPVNAEFVITKGNTTVIKQNVLFNKQNSSQILNLLLPAEEVGLQVYKAQLRSSEEEKNTYNNIKNFAVEVIDQKAEIAIISSINHPDLGVLKRVISNNKQRNVNIIRPSEYSAGTDYNVVILYQPNGTFKSVYEILKNRNVNSWVITGKNTDFNFLNQQQKYFTFKMGGQAEDYLPHENPQFNAFAYDDFGISQMPPLQNLYGTITDNLGSNVLLWSKIRNIETNMPLLSFVESEGGRHAFLFGENIWKWRLYTNFNNDSFDQFDTFVDKTIQFLTSNNTRKSLLVNHESFYNSGDILEITAQYFDKNYEFDQNAKLSIRITNKETKEVKNYDLLKGNNIYRVNFDGLSHGKYDFTITEATSKTSYSSRFEILDFDIEQQFINPDVAKLSQLASQTQGAVFYPDQVQQLIDELIQSEDYKAVEKEIIKKIPLIDNILLLIVIALLLAIEWFVRKYNGML